MSSSLPLSTAWTHQTDDATTGTPVSTVSFLNADNTKTEALQAFFNLAHAGDLVARFPHVTAHKQRFHQALRKVREHIWSLCARSNDAAPQVVAQLRKLNGVCPEAFAYTAYQALRFAAQRGNTALVKALIAHHAPVAYDHANAYRFQLEGELTELIELQAHVDTPITYAVAGGHYECAALLLEAGASPDDKNRAYEETCLMMAIQNHDVPMIDLLCKAGANPFLRSYWGETPLSLAEETHRYRVINRVKRQVQAYRKEHSLLSRLLP